MLMRSKQLRVVLFALTGFGNTVLKALLEDARVYVEAVFTIKYDHPFPYYEEQQLIELCDERGVKCYYGVKVCSDEGIELLRQLSPDLIMMVTFKQILRENVIQLPPLGVINFHPSLLPRYRGPCPTNAALLNDEKITGVTIHYATEALDEGNILLQKAMIIEEEDTDGQLRNKLARLAGEMTPEVVRMFAGFTRPAGAPQDHNLASIAPKPTVEDGYLELATDIDTIRRKMRAFNPLPGTSILVGDSRIAVERFKLIQDSRPDGQYESNYSIDFVIGAQGIRLYK
jgi:methionyl-tRNA formyltransferase